MNEAIPVELVGVRIELPSNTPVVLLREQGGDRYLPIWIGAVEATAIAYALEGVSLPRPMTHDLLRDVLEALGVELDHVVVTRLEDAVFYADLVLVRDGEEVRVSSRPSDAIALAARTGSPLYVSPLVLEEAGIEIRDEEDQPEAEEELARFRRFLDEVTPEDFTEGSGGTEG